MEKLITNGHWREITTRLNDDTHESEQGFTYKGWFYPLSDFMRIDRPKFDGSFPLTNTGGLLIKLSNNCEHVQVTLSIG